MAQLAGRSPRVVLPAVVAGALLLAAGGLATALAAAELASSAAPGMPADWLQRGGWLLVQALGGFGAACALVACAYWRGERREVG